MNTIDETPPTLKELQLWLASRISPRERAEELSPALDRWIAVPAPAAAADRMRVYADGYPARLFESLQEAFPAVAHVVVANADKATFFAAQAVFQREAGAASIALVRQIGGAFPVSNGDVVEPFFPGEFGPRESVRNHGEPRARGGSALHPFFYFRRRVFHEGGVERYFAIALGLPMCGAGGPDAVPVCVDVDGLVSDECAGEHAGGIDRCGVQGGGGDGGVSDGESAGLDSVSQ